METLKILGERLRELRKERKAFHGLPLLLIL